MPDSLNDVIYAFQSSGQIPVDQVRHVWRDPHRSIELLDILIENLRKSGSFGKVEFWMKALSESLTKEEVTDLYTALRSHSLRNELEWRTEFLHWFTACRDSLPDVEPNSIKQFRLHDHLITAVENGDEENTRFLCDCMASIGMNPLDTRVVSLDDLGLSLEEIEELDGDELTSLIDARRRKAGIPILEYAKQLGMGKLLAILTPH